jgi:hypothetical protein
MQLAGWKLVMRSVNSNYSSYFIRRLTVYEIDVESLTYMKYPVGSFSATCLVLGSSVGRLPITMHLDSVFKDEITSMKVAESQLT